MDARQFLDKYFHLLENFGFCELKDYKYALVEYAKNDSNVFWNSALIKNLLSESELSEVERYYQSVQRKSTIYFENTPDLNSFKDFLKERGYSQSFEDSWMFYNKDDVTIDNPGNVKKVESEEDLQIFLRIFDQCYQNDDPQNPYGELGDYLKVIEQVWLNHHNDGIECFVFYDGENPVAVATLNNFEGIGYISNVGSLRSARGKGFGKLATLYCIQLSMKNGNKIHCLATEENTYPNDFYKRLGFKTKFTAVGYSKRTR